MRSDKKEIKWIEYPYFSIYLQYGSLLIDLKRYQETNLILEKAVHWNPMSAYRNWGYYFIEQEKYQAAIGCYLLSLEYLPPIRIIPTEHLQTFPLVDYLYKL